MRVFDALARLLGTLILMVVVTLVPLVAVGQQMLAALQSPSLLSTVVEQYWLDETNLVRLGQRYATEQVQTTSRHDRALVFWRAVASFDDEQWRELVGFFAPREVLAEMINDAASEFVAWLQAPNAAPEVRVSLTAWKRSVTANVPSLVNWFVAQFRPCNVAETAQWGEAFVLDDWSLPPLCLPLGAPRQILVEGIAGGAQNAVQQAPDSITVLDASRAAALKPVKDVLLRAQQQIFVVWLGLAVLALLGLALVSRSWGGALRTLGSIGFWSGVELLTLAFSIDPLVAQAMKQAADVPAWALSAVQNSMTFYLRHILLPLQVPAGIAAGAGGVVWLLGVLVEARRKKAMADTLDRIA